jgi:hypothetical protein
MSWALAQAGAGQGQVVALVGEAGVGKSRRPSSLGDCPRMSTSGMLGSLRHAIRASRWPRPRNAAQPLESKKVLLRRSDTLPRAIAAS